MINSEYVVSVGNLRIHLSDVIAETFYHKKQFIVERHGRPVVVIIPFDEYEEISKKNETKT